MGARFLSRELTARGEVRSLRSPITPHAVRDKERLPHDLSPHNLLYLAAVSRGFVSGGLSGQAKNV
jgi:hypothetical protein